MEHLCETAITITTKGRMYLGTALGSRSLYLKQCFNSNVEEWVGQVTKLAMFALSQPQACYAAFTFGLKLRCPSIMRVSMGSSYDG